MSPREKILDRIRKLYAKAESAKALGSTHEAEAFAAKVSGMLAEYKLSLSDLEMSEVERQEPVAQGMVKVGDAGKRVAWRENLVSIIARAHFCRILVVPRSNIIYLVGRKSDREVAEWMIDWLIPYLWDLSFKEMHAARRREKAAGNYYGARGFRISFLNGFIWRLGERFREMRETVKQQAVATGVALVMINRAEEAVVAYMNTLGTRSAGSVGQRSSNAKGVAAGRAAADRVNLNTRPVRSGGGSGPKQLN